MAKSLSFFLLLFMLFLIGNYSGLGAGDAPKTASIYDFTVKDIDGKEVKLEQYKGKVLLIVNVASQCGYTPQYEGLQKLYSQFQAAGLVVLGFPANNFKGQEPGSNEQIKEFCSTTYGVTFPMFSKISVKGDDIHPLYQYLTSGKDNAELAGEISWNFNKFLVNPAGKVVARFTPADKPESEKIIDAIQQALK
jgi:glutathione peroxidase